jgi:hypothetical protein
VAIFLEILLLLLLLLVLFGVVFFVSIPFYFIRDIFKFKRDKRWILSMIIPFGFTVYIKKVKPNIKDYWDGFFYVSILIAGICSILFLFSIIILWQNCAWTLIFSDNFTFMIFIYFKIDFGLNLSTNFFLVHVTWKFHKFITNLLKISVRENCTYTLIFLSYCESTFLRILCQIWIGISHLSERI